MSQRFTMLFGTFTVFGGLLGLSGDVSTAVALTATYVVSLAYVFARFNKIEEQLKDRPK